MQLIKVGAAVLNQTPLDWHGNLARIVEAIELAKAENVSILCLPELCITGYGCEDAFYSKSLERLAIATLQECAAHTMGIAVSVGLPISYQNALFNTACLLADGKICGFVAKRFLAGDGIYYEPRWFKAWPENTQVQIELDGNSYPLGDLYFDLNGVRVGFEICEDAWVAKRPGSELSLKGVDIILNPSASHFAFGKYEVRKRFVLEGSRAFGVSYVYANHLGNESGRVIFDGGALIASGGKLVAAGSRFSFADVTLTSATIDLDATRTIQSRTGSFKPNLEEDEADRVVVDFTCHKAAPSKPELKVCEWEKSSEIKFEEFLRAVSLGLFDYLRKSRCDGFVISLSGGADSATVACLAAYVVKLGLAELGRERFISKLANPGKFSELRSEQELIQALTLCIYQSTENSGEVTRNAAEAVSAALGCQFTAWSVDSIAKSYVSLGSLALGRELSWQSDDLALQNIQARSRAPGAWLMANLKNALLLVTSNRSEAAVGYATMDGDTAGALSPLGGIDKAFIRAWLRWMEHRGPSGFAAVAALSAINSQQPTAELRPQSCHQTDEQDLMPYEVLDMIERGLILDRQSPVEIYHRLKVELPAISSEQLAKWIEKFCQLWCRNQWKRERYAPSFHLDDESLDPKTWCRFPILSGGFTKELEQLRKVVLAESTPSERKTKA